MRTIKRITQKTAAIATLVALVVTLVFSTIFTSIFVRADDDFDDTKEFTRTELSISNTNFSETSGSYPATPSSWTGSGNGNVISGVVDLTPSVYTGSDSGNSEFKLDNYPEYSSGSTIPKTPFGENSKYENTDKKTLLINTVDGAETVYSYTSESVTFDPNSFYRISAWVKTGDFAANTGATIKLNGLDVDCAFRNINTVKNINKVDGIPSLTEDNDYGFVQYTFYVRTSAALSKTVTISLGIGDSLSDAEYTPSVMPKAAAGYAFFDTVSAERISSFDFAFLTQDFNKIDDSVYTNARGTSMVLDLYDVDYLTTNDSGSEVEIGTFSNVNSTNLNKYWNVNASYDDSETPTYSGAASVSIYNSNARLTETDFDNDNILISKNPWSPLGRAEYDANNSDFVSGTNGNILMISAKNKAARGVASPDVVIERYKYYRFSVWVKDDGVTDGSGISIAVKGQKNDTSTDNKLEQWYNNLEGDTEDLAHYGWKEQIVYIKGSNLSDCTVHFEFWLGTPSSQSSGVAMFDNVTFTELTYSDYTDMSSADGGNTLTLDGSDTDTGITNGTFSSIGDYEGEVSYPLPAGSWTYYTASTVKTTGFSSSTVNTDNVKHGIVPTDENTFNAIRSNGDIPAFVKNPASLDSSVYNALIIASSTKTAVCYQSTSFTASADKGYKVTVDMAVSGVSNDSYGASLVLKDSDSSVIATIEGIRNTNNTFKTFTFYIDAPLSEQTLTLEIWLGLNDRDNNTHKLSDGCVYVKNVANTEWTVESDDDDDESSISVEYNNLLPAYFTAMADENQLKTLDYAMFSFNSPSIKYYDAYSYNLGIACGVPYNWSFTSAKSENSTYGFVDLDNLTQYPYEGFDRKDQSGTMLYIKNNEPNRSTFTYGDTISLVANTYYRLDVTIKVHVTDAIRTDDTTIGANINLTGSVTESFSNIKDTTTLIAASDETSRDYETFKTYSFYISSGDEGGDIGLNISFGGDNRTTYISGTVVISDVTLTSITNTSYEEVADSDDTTYKKAVSLSEASSDDDDDNTEATKSEIQWWLIPTIIFSTCLVAAILIIVIIRIRDHFKKKKKTTYATEYTRNAALDELDRLAEEERKNNAQPQKEYADVDDNTAEHPSQIDNDGTETATELTESNDEQPKQIVDTTTTEPDPSDNLDD